MNAFASGHQQDMITRHVVPGGFTALKSEITHPHMLRQSLLLTQVDLKSSTSLNRSICTANGSRDLQWFGTCLCPDDRRRRSPVIERIWSDLPWILTRDTQEGGLVSEAAGSAYVRRSDASVQLPRQSRSASVWREKRAPDPLMTSLNNIKWEVPLWAVQ